MNCFLKLNRYFKCYFIKFIKFIKLAKSVKLSNYVDIVEEMKFCKS